MTHHWIIPLGAALGCLSLGSAVYKLAPRSPLSQVFAFLTVTLVFWNLNFVALYSIATKSLAFEVARTMRVGSMLLPAAVFHLAVAVRSRTSKPLLAILVVDYVIATIFIAFNMCDLVVADIRTYTWGYSSVGTRIYDIYTIFVISNFIGAVGLLVREFVITHDPRTKLQLKFWLLGLVISLPLGLTNLLPVYGIAFYPLGNLGSAVWSGIVAYAIIRHRLMDIDVFVTKGIAYAGGTLLVLGPTFGALLVMQTLAFGKIDSDFSAAALVLLVIVSVAFPAVRSRAEKGLARSLFRSKYDSRTELTQLAHSIVRILDREKLVHALCGTTSEIFHLDRVALFLLDVSRRNLQLERSMGIQATTERFGLEHPIVRWLTVRAEPVLRAEAFSESVGGSGGPVAAAFELNGWEVVVPLVNGGKLSGFLALGRRRYYQAFGVRDLDILSNVGAEASVAFENARLYADLRRSQEIIARTGRLSALGTLAAGIAHEVRNPLVSIQTFFQLAPQRLNDEEFMTSFLSLAEAEVTRISSLISELLSFAKSPTANICEIDLDDIIERAVTLIAPQARSERVELTTVAADPGPRVMADADQLLQVLLNVVLNAVQATPAGGSVTIETRSIVLHEAAFCQVEVRDTGPGIPSDIQEAIFNPFYTTREKGTGLGLAIAHRIVTEFGGFIALESCEGKGSQFFINLPAPWPKKML